MAYNYFSPYYPMQMQGVQQQSVQPQQMQSSFVTVRSEAEARNYPVAYGNSVTFKDETAPYVYTKTMGFSQLDRPVFDKYKLVKENVSQTDENAPSVASSVKDDKDDLEWVKNEFGAIWKEIKALKKNAVEVDDESA